MKYLFMLLLFFAITPSARAQALPAVDSSYNHKIISDSEFTGGFGFGRADIQEFLDDQGADCEGQLCLKNYHDPDTGQNAATIIAQVSQDFGIHPGVLLVTLQKENSLVTDNDPEEWQYRTAMGYGCPDGADCEADFFGFANQVRLGANLMRAVYDRACGSRLPYWKWTVSPVWYRGNTVVINGRQTWLSNCATAALYNYTPHRVDSAWIPVDETHYYGNYNFVSYWRQWFLDD